MILETGNLLQQLLKNQRNNKALTLVTTNAVVTKGKLVMGRGAALMLKTQMPYIPSLLAQRILENTSYPLYGVAIVDSFRVGGFQTKVDWRQNSTLEIIRHSTVQLFKWVVLYPSLRVDMNFPGISNGGLRREDVLPIVSLLPDNVHIWELE